MDEQITIIEGPPPIFERVNDGWAISLNEGPTFSIAALTRLRTFNGLQLVERCNRAWRNQKPIRLHYRNNVGLEQTAPILAARNVETSDGHMLLLWVYLDDSHVEYELNSDDDNNTDDNLDK